MSLLLAFWGALRGGERWARLLGWALAATAALGLLWAALAHLERRGAERERARIERANAEAARRAYQGEAKAIDCHARGGLWDRGNGTCDR